MKEWIEQLEDLQETCSGQRIRLHLYTTSHRRIVLDVVDGKGDQTFIVLSGCTELKLPTSWQFQVPALLEVKEASGFFRLVDLDAGVEIEFQHLYIDTAFPSVGEL